MSWRIAIPVALLLVCIGMIAIAMHGSRGAEDAPRTVVAPSGLGACVDRGEGPRLASCIEREATRAIRREGIRRGLAAVEADARRSVPLASSCHGPMHAVARSIDAGEAGFDEALQVDGACASGFLHGTIETLIDDSRSADQLASVAGMCERLVGRGEHTSLGARECYHGMGHGIMRHEPKVDSAVERCTAAIGDDRGRLKCMGGVFMEALFQRIDVTLADRMRTCARQAGLAAIACYSYPVRDSEDDPVAGIERWCGPAPAAARWTCWYSWGRIVTVERISWCSATRVADREACLTGFFRGHLVEQRLLTPRQAARRCTAPVDVGSCAHALGRMPEPDVGPCAKLFEGESALVRACGDGRSEQIDDALDIRAV